MAQHASLAKPSARGNAFISIDQKSFETVMRVLRAADEGLYRETRRALLKAGKDVKTAQQEAVTEMEVKGVRGGGGKVRALFAARITAENALTGTLSKTQIRRANAMTGLRSAAARSVSVEVREKPSSRARRTGVTIRLRSSQMPPGQGRLPKHMNYGRWRHPVFGHSDAQWVTQTALPQGWFDGTFNRLKGQALADIGEAVDRALAFRPK